jgi:hypothetical protein
MKMCKLVVFDSGQGPVAGSCEQGDFGLHKMLRNCRVAMRIFLSREGFSSVKLGKYLVY